MDDSEFRFLLLPPCKGSHFLAFLFSFFHSRLLHSLQSLAFCFITISITILAKNTGHSKFCHKTINFHFFLRVLFIDLMRNFINIKTSSIFFLPISVLTLMVFIFICDIIFPVISTHSSSSVSRNPRHFLDSRP